MTDYIFNIFGSSDSLDYDIMVVVDEISTNISESSNIVKSIESDLKMIFNDEKPLNVNLAIIDNGIIIKTFKGTPDECTNAIYYTYDLHKQYCDRIVNRTVERDIDLKILRFMRFLTTLLSRSEIRSEIKPTIKGTLIDKTNVLKNVDLNKITLEKKNLNEIEICKKISSQISQLLSLINGVEIYTKKEMVDMHPDLEPYIYRKFDRNIDKSVINSYIKSLINIINNNYNHLLDKNENNYI